MGRLAWSQLRFRTARLIALLAGMLVATTAFTVLTAASRTSQLRTIGTVSTHFVPAYDILVRPAGTRTRLETAAGTVQPNFLSGIYGGITMAQYHQIQAIPGVQVAAPMMVGYTLLTTPLGRPLPASVFDRPGRQLYRITTTWVSAAGTSRVTQPPPTSTSPRDRPVSTTPAGSRRSWPTAAAWWCARGFWENGTRNPSASRTSRASTASRKPTKASWCRATHG